MEQNPQNQPPQYGQPQYPPSGAPPQGYPPPQYPPSGAPPQGYPPSSPYQQPYGAPAPTAQPMPMAIGLQPHIVVPIAAAVLFIATFLPWYSFSFSYDTGFGSVASSSSSINAWYFWEGIFTGIIAILAAAYSGLRYFKVQMPVIPLSDKLIYLILGGAGLLFSLIYLIAAGTSYSGGFNGPGYHSSYGPSFGLFIGLLASLGILAGAYLTGRPGFADLMARPMTPPPGVPPQYGMPPTGAPPQYGAPPQMPQYGVPPQQPPYGQPPQQPPTQG